MSSSFHSIDPFCASAILDLTSVWASQCTLVYGTHGPPTFLIFFFFSAMALMGHTNFFFFFLAMALMGHTQFFFPAIALVGHTKFFFFFSAMALMGHTQFFFSGYGTRGPH